MAALLNLLSVLSVPTDLTWNLGESTTHWPSSSPFEFTQKIVNENNGFWYAMNDFKMGEHTGTHLDAPYHFYKNGWKVSEIPLQRLMVPGVLINVSVEAAANSDYELSVRDIQNWELKHGPIPNNSVVLIDFGWSKYYNSPDKYFGLSTNNNSNFSFPGISAQAAEWIAESNKIYGVGVDTGSVDAGKSLTYDAHRTLALKNMFNLENVALNTPLPAKGFTLIIMPLLIKDGTGAPARVVAIPQNKCNYLCTGTGEEM